MSERPGRAALREIFSGATAQSTLSGGDVLIRPADGPRTRTRLGIRRGRRSRLVRPAGESGLLPPPPRRSPPRRARLLPLLPRGGEGPLPHPKKFNRTPAPR